MSKPAKSPARKAVRRAVANALLDGTLVRDAACAGCGRGPYGKTALNGHHEDYSRPLDVVWLCPNCHRARHRRRTASALGARLAELRRRAGLTQARMTRALGVATQQISAWETGAAKPTSTNLGRYLDAVGAKWGALVGVRVER